MTILHFTNHSISHRWLINSFLLVIFGTLLTTWSLVGCRQQDMDQPVSYMNLRRVGDNAIPHMELPTAAFARTILRRMSVIIGVTAVQYC
jgi:hypothetical protein